MEAEWERSSTIIRPANYGDDVIGKGVCVLDRGAYSIAVINLMGTTFMQPLENPFHCVDRILESCDARIKIVDFHAEATSEKRAMGYYLAAGCPPCWELTRMSRPQTKQIIEGTGYITDAGMTGPKDSILGVEKDIIIDRFLTYYPKRHRFAEGETEMNGVLLDIDTKTGRCTFIERYRQLIV